jgi:hypothetical protein
MSGFKILRFVERDFFSEEDDAGSLDITVQDLIKCCVGVQHKTTVIQTCGGCLTLEMDVSSYSHGQETHRRDFQKLVSEAEKGVFDFLLSKELQAALSRACNFLTLGVDAKHYDPTYGTHAELVGVYDTDQHRFLGWTGKSYPVQHQTRSLMYCKDLESHFIKLDNVSVMVLGCHDLNIFSPRSRASASRGSYKDRVMAQMDHLVRKYQPEVVLHHPHSTDSPRIWQTAWSGVRQSIPSCHTYSSGIFYGFRGNPPRGRLDKVLASTAKGKVENWIQNTPKGLRNGESGRGLR